MKNKGNYCKMLYKIVIACVSRGIPELAVRKPEMKILKNIKFAFIINTRKAGLNQ